MSQFILCRGKGQETYLYNIMMISYPFDNEFLAKASSYFWDGESNVFTIVNRATMQIDSYFTEAQQHLSEKDGKFRDTKLFNLLNRILDDIEEIVMWYSSYVEDIPITSSKEEFFKAVEDGIKEPTCEVYVRYIKRM